MEHARALTRPSWHQALSDLVVWKRAARLGLLVGALQAALNQGDHWYHGRVDGLVIAKTILSPLLSFTIAFASIAATRGENKS